MFKLKDDQLFESLMYRHKDQVKLLDFINNQDIKLNIHFLTLQLILGGFLSQLKEFNLFSKIGFMVIDIAFATLLVKLLLNNFKRRKEVVETIKNCNKALGYDDKDIYIEGTLNSKTKFRPWFGWYISAVALSVIGICSIIFGDFNLQPNY